jgi:hypothetical protein
MVDSLFLLAASLSIIAFATNRVVAVATANFRSL